MNKTQLEEGLELAVQFDERTGLVPAIAQDYNSGEILMLAYANQEALDGTLKSGYATFWSRSRDELWTKGMTSGDLLEVEEILVDCDQDALIYKVTRVGDGTCHTKDKEGNSRISCFYKMVNPNEDGLEYIRGME